MLKASLRRIKSAPKRSAAGAILVLVVLAICVLAITGRNTATNTLRIGNQSYELETAATESSQQKGLGDRTSMAANHGMLFVFAGEGQQCFWMKDMHFPLDIIWTDTSKKITAIEPDLSPASYPKTYCHDGRFVIEVHAGVSASNHLAVGRQLSF